MKKLILILITLSMSFAIMMPRNTYALSYVNTNDFLLIASSKKKSKNDAVNDIKSKNKYDDVTKCDSLLGSPSDPNSVAWLLYKILNYMMILGPLAVVVLSGVEFTRAIVNSDDDTMKKATGHLKTRLFMAALLFLIPTLTKLLFQVFKIATDCGLFK